MTKAEARSVWEPLMYRLTEADARAMFREYLIEDCFMYDDDALDRLYADPDRLMPEWRAWLQQTQVEHGFVSADIASKWTP
jgi:hypothetical protein